MVTTFSLDVHARHVETLARRHAALIRHAHRADRVPAGTGLGARLDRLVRAVRARSLR